MIKTKSIMRKLLLLLVFTEVFLFILFVTINSVFLLCLFIVLLPIVKIVHFYYVYEIKPDVENRKLIIKTSWKNYSFKPQEIDTWKIVSHKVQGTSKCVDINFIIQNILVLNTVKTEINRKFLVLEDINNKTYYFPYDFNIPAMDIMTKNSKRLLKETEQLLGKPPEKEIKLDPGLVGESLLPIKRQFLWIRLSLFWLFY